MADVIRAGLHMLRMKQSERNSPDELALRQEESLARLCAYASAHVPHYRKAGLRFRSMDDLALLPFSTKESLRSNPDSFLSDSFRGRPLEKISTSGSTGMPVSVFQDGRESDMKLALEYHQLTECGVRPLQRQAHHTYYRLEPRFAQKLGLFRREYLSFYDDDSVNLKKLRRMSPDVLHGYPSYLAPIALTNMQGNYGVRVAKVFSSAELLSDASRKIIASSFGCDLRDFYGSTETSWIAWQCERGSMHIHSDSIIVEIIGPDGEPLPHGKFGEVVLTPLWKRVMPFIRYRIGDRAALGGQCRCGRNTQTLLPIQGRNDDFIVLPSGKVRSPRFVDLCLRPVPEIRLYQAFQPEPGRLQLRIVPSGTLGRGAQQKIMRNLKKSLSEDMKISIEIVDDLPRGRSGKIQSVVSKVKPDFGMGGADG
ncbi:hypothetical protein L0Y65_00875 [Candidatus Micrarchaeota archaeon]|nr:hypothetical protein [Candidatus Micrarchaeota archaeon]